MSMAHPRAIFVGFPPEAQAFLRGIEKNNNREWFEKNKPVYEASVKGAMAALVEAMNQELLKYAPEYITDPKQAIFRIYRDVRFAKDKKPYKTNIAALWFRQNLGKNETAFFYLHLDAQELFFGAGVYMPGAETLKTLRNHVADHHEQLRAILADRKFRQAFKGLDGEPAKRTPKGFLPGHPAEDLLRHKMYIVSANLDPALAYTPKLVSELSKLFKTATPLVEYLNGALRPKPARIRF